MERKRKKITVPEIAARKGQPSKITALTAYDFTFARLIDEAGVDIILVGDSLAGVIQGHSNTLPATIDEVVYHTKCVARGVKNSLVVADLPFLSYQVSREKAIESAGRLLKEGGAAAVKLEGGIHMAETINAIVNVDIPVMGHVGLTPQSYHRMGGHKVQGRGANNETTKAGTYKRVIMDAQAVESAGAFAVVIECVPAELAAEITAAVNIPTIGIGAGKDCDGQILVMHDLLGLEDRRKPKFVKHYLELAGMIKSAVGSYVEEVNSGQYPAPEHSFDGEEGTPNFKILSGSKK